MPENEIVTHAPLFRVIVECGTDFLLGRVFA